MIKKDIIKKILEVINELKVNIDVNEQDSINITELNDFIKNFKNQTFDQYNTNLQKVKTALEKYKRALFIIILDDMKTFIKKILNQNIKNTHKVK